MAQCPGNEYKAAKLDWKLQKPEFPYFIGPWVKRARESGEPFESLIHLWVAFNAWLAEVVSPPELMEKDLALISAAARDTELSSRFDDLLHRDARFKAIADEFQSLWPVFNVRRLDQAGLGPWESWQEDRGTYRDSCFRRGATDTHYKPGCFVDHQAVPMNPPGGDPGRVPLDWPHTLFSIYQVRCNLFHGGKTFRMESDRHFAAISFEILWSVWGSSFGV